MHDNQKRDTEGGTDGEETNNEAQRERRTAEEKERQKFGRETEGFLLG